MVGVTGFEPAASWSRTKRSTKLSHTPVFFFRKVYYNTEKRVCQAEKPTKSKKKQIPEQSREDRGRTEGFLLQSFSLFAIIKPYRREAGNQNLFGDER